MVLQIIVAVLCLVVLGCVPAVVADLRSRSGMAVVFEWVCFCLVILIALSVIIYEAVSFIRLIGS